MDLFQNHDEKQVILVIYIVLVNFGLFSCSKEMLIGILSERLYFSHTLGIIWSVLA